MNRIFLVILATFASPLAAFPQPAPSGNLSPTIPSAPSNPNAASLLKTLRFDWNQLRAAMDLGASPLTAIRRILLPQIRPGIVTAVIFLFIPMLGEYLTPQIVGGTHPVVYPADGSHAGFYDEALYLGSSGSQGVGCDDTRNAGLIVHPYVVTIPSDPAAARAATLPARASAGLECSPASPPAPTGSNGPPSR